MHSIKPRVHKGEGTALRIKVGHDHVMQTIIEIPSDSSIHFLWRETGPLFTRLPQKDFAEALRT